MAHKADSFKLNTKKKAIILYTNITPSPAEQMAIDSYLKQGFTVLFEEKKTVSVADMRKALKESKCGPVLELFNDAYNKKTDTSNFKESGFYAACAIYNNHMKYMKMREALKEKPEALEELEKAYNNGTGFGAACEVYKKHTESKKEQADQ